MGLVSVDLSDFRNLCEQSISCEAPRVFLIGENGQGKTNFIEAVYLLCFGSSFRTRVHARMIRHDAEQAIVRGVLHPADEPPVSVAIRIHATRDIKVNGEGVRDRKLLLRYGPCVVFCHEDMEFVTGSPERRRRFFDQTLTLADPVYLDVLRTYRRALRARNVLLREGKSELLEPYDYELARWGCEIRDRRAWIMEPFCTVFSGLYARISGQEPAVGLRYAPSWSSDTGPTDVLRLLAAARARDMAASQTTTGPHRDRFIFEMDGTELAHVGSTGQMRLCSLVLRSAQASHYAQTTGRLPILLLDDVILELDTRRKVAFLDALPPCDQAFFTFLPGEEFQEFRTEETQLLRVENGAVEPWGGRR